MKLGFSEIQGSYVSGSQSARVLSETWVADAMYCPNCGNERLHQFPSNLPVADFFCGDCNDQYELKCQKKEFGRKLINGAYEAKVRRLESDSSPNLILMSYDLAASTVRHLCVIPRRFFVAAIVEKRKPLSPTARRAGWIGSNILLDRIPEAGRIHIVRNGIILSREHVLDTWKRTRFLGDYNQSARGWLLEVMRCVEHFGSSRFTLDDIYRFEAHLSGIYPQNNNVRPKIRQQLQVLRDGGFIEFLGNGSYRALS